MRNQQARTFLRVGHWIEIVQHIAAKTSPAHMVGNPHRFDAAGQAFHPRQIVQIEPGRRANRHGDAVHGDGIVAPYALEHHQRLAAIHQKIVGDDLQPVHRLGCIEKILIVRCAQSKTETGAGSRWHHVGNKVEGRIVAAAGTCRRDRACVKLGAYRSPTVPALATQSFRVTALKPWPLQAFWPLQLCSAVLQSLLP